VQAVLPRPDIAPLLEKRFVALAGDPDLPEPEVHRLLFNLKNSTMLPFVILATPDGQFLGGMSGAVDPKALRRLLEGAVPPPVPAPPSPSPR
jgi:hypothetical protein